MFSKIIIPSCFMVMFLVLVKNVFASDFHDTVSCSIGMVNLSVRENPSELVQTDTTVTPDADEDELGTSSKVSATSFEAVWDFKTYASYSYFLKAQVPLLTTSGAGVYLGGIGVNWYFNKLAVMYSYTRNGTDMVVIPKFRYYAGINSGVGYLIYNTESAKKSDVVFDLGVQAGISYLVGTNWNLKGEVAMGRATGAATISTKMGVMFGMVYYL